MNFGKISKLPDGVKASISFFLASLITKGISYIATPIFTRLLTADEFGKVSVYYTWMQLFGIIAMFCLSYGVFNVGLLKYPDKRDEFSFSVLILSNIITLSFAGLILCLYPIIERYLNIQLPFLILMIVFFMLQPAYNLWLVRQRFDYKYKWTFFWSCFTAIVSTLVPVVLIILFRHESYNLYYRIFGAEIVLIAIYIGFYIFLGVKTKFKVNAKYWKEVFLFNLPLIPHYLSSFILSGSDKLMISYLINDDATAYYSVAYSISSIALIIWHSIDGSFLPFTFKKMKDNDYASIKKVSIPLLSVFAVGCFLVILLGPEIVSIMGTEAYSEAALVIPAVVGGVFFQIQYFMYSNVLYYHKKRIGVLIGSVVAAVLNLILNYFCISKFGYIAAGYTTLACYFVQAIIDYIALRRVEKHDVYNIKFISILSGVVIVVSLFSGFLYGYPRARYAIIAMSLILLLVNSRKVINLFKTLRNKE